MLEHHLAAYFESLRAERYGEEATYHHRQVLREFLVYLDERVPTPEEIAPEHWKKYLDARDRLLQALRGQPMSALYRKRYDRVLANFLRFLAERGLRTRIAVPERKDIRDVPGHRELLADYEKFIAEHRGLKPSSVRYYLNQAARFCVAMAEGRLPGWKELTPDLLYEYLRGEAHRLGHLSLAGKQSAMRLFFRFLHVTGRCPDRLDRYLLSFPNYKLARVPPRIAPEDSTASSRTSGTTPRATSGIARCSCF